MHATTPRLCRRSSAAAKFLSTSKQERERGSPCVEGSWRSAAAVSASPCRRHGHREEEDASFCQCHRGKDRRRRQIYPVTMHTVVGREPERDRVGGSHAPSLMLVGVAIEPPLEVAPLCLWLRWLPGVVTGAAAVLFLYYLLSAVSNYFPKPLRYQFLLFVAEYSVVLLR